MRFFAVLFFGKRIAVISMTPCKIRSMTMKNFAENTSEHLPEISTKNKMLKWARQGGGGQDVEES
jgi:hypothetical protein